MKLKPLFYCTICRRSDLTKQSRHMHKGSTCTGNFVAVDPNSCIRCYYFTNPGCASPLKQNANPATKSTCFFAPPSSPSVASVQTKAAPKKLAKIKKLKPISLRSGDPDQVADNFRKLFASAEDAKLRIVAFGIYAHHVKLNLLKHGQFGPWVEETLKGNGSGSAGSYRTVREHMQFAESTLQAAGVKALKPLLAKWQPLPICHSGEFLMLPEAKVPAEAKPIREKILTVLEGKTKKQLFHEWKQAEEDASGNVRPKRGNLSGKGCTKEDRERAALAEEEARVTELNLASEDTEKWLLLIAGPKGFPCLTPERQKGLAIALETATSFIRNFEAAQKGTR